MTIKINRESLLVILTAVMLLIGIFYYGNLYFLETIKNEADAITQTVEAQESLIVNYPPSEASLNAYQEEATALENYLPIGDQTNTALITLENLADTSEVNILSVTRNSFQEPVEGISDEFVKNKYIVEFQTNSPSNIRQLMENLTNEERVWNVTGLTYSKVAEDSYTGNFEFELYYFSKYNQSEQINNEESTESNTEE